MCGPPPRESPAHQSHIAWPGECPRRLQVPLDPFLAGKVRLLDDVARSSQEGEALDRFQEYSRDPAPWSTPHGVRVEHGEVSGPHGPVPCRIYLPATTTGIGLVWVHGGGFSSGDLDMPEAHVVSAELAARARAVVVSVGYRLATEGVRYPVPIDDVAAAWTSVAHGKELACTDGIERLCLGGASAGAALALSTAMRVRDAGGSLPSALLLAYPFAHFPNPAPEPALSAELAVLPELLRFFPTHVEDMVLNYVGRLTDLPPDALPGTAPLHGLPPVHMVASEYDDLRSSAELLRRQLEEVDVEVASYLSRGMPHGHLNRTPSIPEVDRSLDFFAAALRAAGRRTH
ncbi:alpha/beta hydrolase fold domain-containing protein [Nocardioides sp. WG-D5]